MTAFTSHMAGAADPLMAAIAEMHDMEWRCGPWDVRLRALTQGSIEAGWICGLLYSELHRQAGDLALAPIAAPVMSHERYGDTPVYFGDLVVRADSELRTIDDLGDAVVAYNESSSLSGYRMLIDHFGSLDGFAGAVESGSHADSIRMVASGAAGVASIDSTLLDMLAVQSPGHVEGLRVIGSLGPYPAPPVVAWPQAAASLRSGLLRMHEARAGRRLLSEWGVARFAPVDADVYRPLARSEHR